jgi:SAM-dependent methyltransferase
MAAAAHGGSPSIARPEYWWYRVRTALLQAVFEDFVGQPARVLDVGSADGPSVEWLKGRGVRTALDLDPRGLRRGDVCGSALALPFADQSFDVVAAFDVIEHVPSEDAILSELARVLRPGGRLLVSVPAYQWAWSGHDVANGHHRRYTRPRAVAAVRRAGLDVRRSTYAFTSVFPMFAAERLGRRMLRSFRPRTSGVQDVAPLPEVSPVLDRLLTRLGRVDERLLRKRDLPFGSSVLVAATKR